MKITYLDHSGFVVESEHAILLFDYYKGDIPEWPLDKPVYVFASHKHYDHFNLKIFVLSEKYPSVTYILSKDIKMSKAYMVRHRISEHVAGNIRYINAGEKLSLPYVAIQTLKSTDVGVAFLITCEEHVIYHAGDLNWWTWKGETEEEYMDMTERYQSEINSLKGIKIDVAFLSLDPRQEERFSWGFDYFMKTTDTKNVFPMHFWKDFSVIDKLLELDCASEYADRVVKIDKEGDIKVI